MCCPHRAADPRYPLVALAPEGTCGDNRCILQFKTGAFVSGLPVLPVMLRYNLRSHNPSWTIITEWRHLVRLPHACACCYTQRPQLRLLCQLDAAVDVTVLPPYVPSAAERADARVYATNVRALYSKTLGLPMVNQSQHEYRSVDVTTGSSHE